MAKRLFYLTTQNLSVYHWQDGRLYGPFEFLYDQTGFEDFEKFLSHRHNILSFLLVDFVEEEFRSEKIPHVVGGDKRALLKRKLNQFFRSTPYRQAIIQDREKTGRRDDIALFAALTNPGLFDPWMERIKKFKVPVAGIYSLPLLTSKLVKKLDFSAENLLLITHQKYAGLRLSFFNFQKMKMSRLSSTAIMEGDDYVAFVQSEIEKSKRYLTRLRLISRDSPLVICIVSHGETLKDLKNQIKDSQNVSYRLIDMADVGENLGMEKNEISMFCDNLFAGIFFHTTPLGNYAKREDMLYQYHRLARIGIFLTGVVIGLGSLAWTGVNIINGLLNEKYAQTATRMTSAIAQEYQASIKDIPKTPINPMGLKESVETAARLLKSRTSPKDIMIALSQGLNHFPELQIDGVDWVVTSDPDATLGDVSFSQNVPNEQDGVNTDGKKGLYQIALIKGQVKPFDGNYKAAFETVNRLVQMLRASGRFQSVTPVKFPLNINSDANLVGSTDAGHDEPTAFFTLKAVIRLESEST